MLKYINISCIFILFAWIILRIALRCFKFKSNEYFLIIDIIGIIINLFEILLLKHTINDMYIIRSVKAVSVAF